MFSNRWFRRASASHWLSPSVSIPTSRCMGQVGSAVLVGVTERDVPVVGLVVKRRFDIDAIDLDDELEGRLHLEVARTTQDATKHGVHGKAADLVGIRVPRLAVHP